jgi:hypothetical protein
MPFWRDVAAEIEAALAGQHHVEQHHVPRFAVARSEAAGPSEADATSYPSARSRSVSVSTSPGSSSTSSTRLLDDVHQAVGAAGDSVSGVTGAVSGVAAGRCSVNVAP